MRVSLIKIFQIRDRVEHTPKTGSSAVMTVDYACWKPWLPTPDRIRARKKSIEDEINRFDSSKIPNASGLKGALQWHFSKVMSPQITILTVRYGPKTAKPKD